MEGLSFDNILGEQDIATLFTDPEEPATQEEQADAGNKEPDEHDETNKTTEVVDSESLFAPEEPEEKKEPKKEAKEEKEDKQPESVGSDEAEGEKEDATSEDEDGTSPNENFYSSIAETLAENGIFPNLDADIVQKANDPESFSELFDMEVNARLDEAQRRVKKALENGVEPNDIRNYEQTISYLSSIDEKDLIEESEKGEELRKRIIYQDFINKGYTPEKAQKLTARSIETGNDMEDAKEALQSNMDHFQRTYNEMLKKAEMEAEEEKTMRRKLTEKVKDSILKDKNLLGDMEITESQRKKAYETIFKPVYKDPETGEYLTALQKYQQENESDFLKYAGLIFTVTNGFKDFESFAKGKVKKEVKKSFKELEQKLSNTKRSSDGSLKLATSVKEDPESFFSGLKLDI